jgi:hypothetical protein
MHWTAASPARGHFALLDEFGGAVDFAFTPAGVQCSFELPAVWLTKTASLFQTPMSRKHPANQSASGRAMVVLQF